MPGSTLASDRDIGAGCLLAARLHVSSHKPLPQRCPAFLSLWDCRRPYSHAHLEGGPKNRIARLGTVASIASNPYSAHRRSYRGEHPIYLDKADAELPLDAGNSSPARSGGLVFAFAGNPSF